MIDNKEGKEAWNYICDLISKGGLVESFKEAITWDKVQESFANGEATFLLGGDWCSSGVENINPDLDYGIAPMVKGKQKQLYWEDGPGILIPTAKIRTCL